MSIELRTNRAEILSGGHREFGASGYGLQFHFDKPVSKVYVAVQVASGDGSTPSSWTTTLYQGIIESWATIDGWGQPAGTSVISDDSQTPTMTGSVFGGVLLYETHLKYEGIGEFLFYVDTSGISSAVYNVSVIGVSA